MFENENPTWEAELQQRANELLAGRLNPLKAELERLQATFTEFNARLLEQTQSATTAAETSGLTAQIKDLLQASAAKAEQRYQELLQTEVEKARELIANETRQQLEAEFQVKLEQNTQAIKTEAEAEIEQLHHQIASLTATQPTNVTAAAPTTPAPYSLFKAAVEEIDAQRTQSETLTALITRAAQFSPRVAFYVVKSGEAVGWKTIGFENGLSDETARSLAVSIHSPSLIGEALNTQRAAIALNPSQAEITPILGRFSHPVPQGAVAVPLVVRGKAAAVLYADSGIESDDAIQLEAIEALIQVASMAIELLPVRRNAGDMGRFSSTAQTTQPPASARPSSVQAAPTPSSISTEPSVPTPPTEVSPQVAIFEQPSSAYEPYSQEQAVSPAPQQTNEVASTPYTSDPATNRQEERQFETNPEATSAGDKFQTQSEIAPGPSESSEPPESPVSAVETLPDEQAHPVSQPVASEPAPEDEKPSIYDLLRASSTESMLPSQNPSVSLPGLMPPDAPPVSFAGDLGSRPGTALPDWMQRLQEEQSTEEPSSALSSSSSPEPTAFSTWPGTEENLSSAAPTPPPAPPTPPPLRVPTLPEPVSRTTEEADTERLPAPPPAQPFQSESPSVRFSFNQPSEPPRYAAPSLSVSNAATETEVRAHNDARRFARLLVSEIKLYNAAKVNEGRRQSDLYDRLKDEIDRSRKVYDKRVSPAVAAKFDYFYDELVQTLAEGDPSKLGENCPGPVVITA